MTIDNAVVPNGGSVLFGKNNFGAHAINRSQELLSCSRTALKIAKAEEDEKRRKQASAGMDDEVPLSSLLPELKELKLYSSQSSYGSSASNNQYNMWVDDASKILSLLDSRLTKLNGLVKNRSLAIVDPTKDIHNLVQEFQTISSRDLVPLVQQLATIPCQNKNGKQKQQHYKYIATWMQTQAAAKTKTLEGIMTLRGNLLKEYHQARQRLIKPNNTTHTTNAQTDALIQNNNNMRTTLAPPRKTTMAKNQLSSPLFQTLPSQKRKINVRNIRNNANSSQPTTATTSSSSVYNSNPYKASNEVSSNNAYNSYSNSAGYGGGAYDSYYSNKSSNGMNGANQLRRRGNASSTSVMSQPQQQQQQQQQQQEFQEKQQQHIYKTRQKSRADMARQTESKLAELSSLFGKMSTLIVAQGETLEKIEDDVEAAVDYVNEGHEQINILYEITQNNRSLIIKVFTILIGLIIFMKLY